MYNYTHHRWCATLAAFIAATGAVVYTGGALAKRDEAITFLTNKTPSHA